MGPDIRQAYLGMRKAGKNRFPPECLEYLYQFIFRTSLRGKEFNHLSARDLCGGFQSQVVADFGEMAAQVLESWDIHSFAELGDAIFLLAEYGCLKLGDEDKREEYAAVGPIRLA